MAESNKSRSEYDFQQIVQKVYNTEGGTLGVDSWLVGKVGRKIVQTISTTTVANDTLVFAFSEDGNAMFELTVVYTDGNRDTFLSAERTA